MGVNTNDVDMEKFDLLKDMEVARANLNEKLVNVEENNKENLSNLPLEEMKYIEWNSNSSEKE
jgi:hypothetical protein